MNTTDAKKIVTGSKKGTWCLEQVAVVFLKIVFTVEPSDKSSATIARWLHVYCLEFWMQACYWLWNFWKVKVNSESTDEYDYKE